MRGSEPLSLEPLSDFRFAPTISPYGIEKRPRVKNAMFFIIRHFDPVFALANTSGTHAFILRQSAKLYLGAIFRHGFRASFACVGMTVL